MSIDLRALARPVLILAAVAALLLAWGPPASAHTELRASTPEEGTTVEDLSEVRLEFTDDLLDIGAELTLVDADGTEHELEPEFPSTNAVTGAVENALVPGETELRWRIVAEDGHPIEGVVAFTYAGQVEPEAPAESPGPVTDDPSAASEPAPATPSPTASAVPLDDESDDTPAWLLPLVALVAAGGALVAILAAKARQR